jgi:thiol-disulfide isomerase/thioredoxin
MKILGSAASLLVMSFVLLGCQQQPPPQKSFWKGAVVLPEQKQLPFEIYLDLTPPAPSGYFLNGSERTPIPEIYHRGDSLVFVFSEYGAAMRGVWSDKRLEGQFLRFRKDTIVNAFEAMPVSEGEESAKPRQNPGVPLVGKFQVYFKSPKGIDSSSQATFWSDNDSVFGTIIAPDGDYGLMAGKQSGDSVSLGRFTGWQGQLMLLTREQNHWTGTLYYRMPPPTSFSLEPRVRLPEKHSGPTMTSAKDPRKPFVFSGLTVTGDTITNLDPRFKGKAVIIDIMGTWCHNCMDETPLLQQLYSEFGGQGLEVVGLSFELSNDFPTARKNLLLYEERYGVTFPVLFCGSLADANVGARIRSQLNNFFAYPTAIFVDRKGIIRQIHEGFKGPGTGEEYQGEVSLLYSVVRDLLQGKSARR